MGTCAVDLIDKQNLVQNNRNLYYIINQMGEESLLIVEQPGIDSSCSITPVLQNKNKDNYAFQNYMDIFMYDKFKEQFEQDKKNYFYF